MTLGHSAEHWRLPVTDSICGGRGNLYGGCGLAAVIEAAEGSGRETDPWATCQFVGGAKPPDVIDLHVEVLATGHYMSQARITGYVDGNLFLTASAAVGRRPSIAEGMWEKMPIVPPPDQCPSRKLANEERRGGLRPRIDERTATIGTDGFMAADAGGSSALWATMPGGVPAFAQRWRSWATTSRPASRLRS